MIKMCFSLFIFILITFQVEAENSCNDKCLTKTFCVSSNGSGVCSEKNLVTAQFKVIPDFGTYDYLQITLKGYNVTSNDEKTIKMAIDQSGSRKIVYTCHKSSNGSIDTRIDGGNYSVTTGSSSYEDGVLHCVWGLSIHLHMWPVNIELFKDITQSITLYDDSKEVIVARNTTQLPMYHAQYLKCCNNVHGNDEVLVTFDQDELQIRYQLYYWEYNVNEVALTLTRKDGIKLQFECHLRLDEFDGYIINGAEKISINHQFIEPVFSTKATCSWATTFVLGYSTISIDASNSVFDLKVDVGSTTVYTEKDVVLQNLKHLQML